MAKFAKAEFCSTTSEDTKKWNLKIFLKIHTGHFPSHRLDNTKTKYFIEFSLILTCRGIIWRQGESTTNFFGNTLSSPRLLFPDVHQIENFNYRIYQKNCNQQLHYHLAIAQTNTHTTWIPGLPYDVENSKFSNVAKESQ